MLRYESGSTGEILDLSGDKMKAHIKSSDLYDYEWEIEELKMRIGTRIATFRKKPAEHTLLIDFIGNKDVRKENADRFFEVVEKDIIEKKPGKLYLNDQYKKCYIIGAKNEGKQERSNIVRMELGIYAEQSDWIKEVTLSFPKFEEESGNAYLDFPYDFTYDYTGTQKGISVLENDHYADTNFKLIIYGPIKDPVVNIGGYPYQVYTTVEENEYLTIESADNLVMRTLPDGTEKNEYDKRNFEDSVFRLIPPGKHNVMWSGEFGWDVTLYQGRSEAKW